MSKNRKHQTAAIRFGPALKASFLCLLIGGSAVGYVWQKSEILRLGQEIRHRESKLLQLQADNKRLNDQITILHSPVMLDRRTKELNLGLAPATPMQVVRLDEPVAPAPAGNVPRQFTQRSMNSVTP
jgi:hypothetical protein